MNRISAADDVRRPAGRHVEHREEDGEEQERRAEVPLHDDDPEGDRPHRDHRGEVRDRRQADRPDPRALVGEQGAVLRQVRRQEHDEDHLQQLRRLAGQRPDGQRQPRAVDVAAEHEGQQQQGDARGRPRVLVGPQPGVRADHQREHRDHGQREEQPAELQLAEAELRVAELLDDEVLRQPLHQQQADAAQHGRRREEDLVGAATGEHERQVDDEQGHEVDDQAAQVRRHEVEGAEGTAGAQVLLGAEAGAERRAAHEQGHGDEPEQGQLGPAQPRVDLPRGSTGGPGRRRSLATPVEAEAHLAHVQLVAEARAPRRGPPASPLTKVPLVLARSSTYQARPRKVSTACSADANGSSTTIVLLTSRPSVVTASSGNEVPSGGSPWARRARPAARAPPDPCWPPGGRASGRARPRTGSRTGGRGTGSG